MKNCEFAELVGITPQHMSYVLRGERNLSLAIARRASAIAGGSIEVWMDPKMAAQRRHIVKKFKGET